MKLTRDLAGRCRAAAFLDIALAAFAVSQTRAEKPVGPFDITRYSTNQATMLPVTAVLIHFDTEPNRRYELQFSTNATAASPPEWKKLYVADPFPFPNHYIYYHELTNGPAGFYRLIITP